MVASRRVARRTLICGYADAAHEAANRAEAAIGEFEETSGSWDVVRWALSGPAGDAAYGADSAPGTHSAPSGCGGRRNRSYRLTGEFLRGVRSLHSVRCYGAHAAERQPRSHRRAELAMVTRGALWVKWLIGLPGDVIECRSGGLYRKLKVDENYLTAGTVTQCSAVTIRPGQTYALGDNRQDPRDSQQLGTFASAAAAGRLLINPSPAPRFRRRCQPERPAGRSTPPRTPRSACSAGSPAPS